MRNLMEKRGRSKGPFPCNSTKCVCVPVPPHVPSVPRSSASTHECHPRGCASAPSFPPPSCSALPMAPAPCSRAPFHAGFPGNHCSLLLPPAPWRSHQKKTTSGGLVSPTFIPKNREQRCEPGKAERRWDPWLELVMTTQDRSLHQGHQSSSISSSNRPLTPAFQKQAPVIAMKFPRL